MHRPEVAGEAFNFSDERPQSVLDIVARVLAAVGRPELEPVVLGEANHEIKEQFLASQKARERLGWTPRFGLEDGLARTVAWYRELLA